MRYFSTICTTKLFFPTVAELADPDSWGVVNAGDPPAID
jgi:hypothetical protein